MRPDVEVIHLRQRRVREAFVVTQIEIGLGAVVSNENLAVLERAHRSRIDVEIRVEFLQRDTKATALEQASNRRRPIPLPREETTPPVTEYIFGHRHHPLKSEAFQKVLTRFFKSSGVSTPSESYSVRQREFDTRFQERVTVPGAPLARAVRREDRNTRAQNRADKHTADVFEVRRVVIAGIGNRKREK